MPTFVGASQYCREISCTAISISPYIGPYWRIRTVPRRNTNHKKDIVSRTGESQSRKYIFKGQNSKRQSYYRGASIL